VTNRVVEAVRVVVGVGQAIRPPRRGPVEDELDLVPGLVEFAHDRIAFTTRARSSWSSASARTTTAAFIRGPSIGGLDPPRVLALADPSATFGRVVAGLAVFTAGLFMLRA
jgi:hypothetical protein